MPTVIRITYELCALPILAVRCKHTDASSHLPPLCFSEQTVRLLTKSCLSEYFIQKAGIPADLCLSCLSLSLCLSLSIYPSIWPTVFGYLSVAGLLTGVGVLLINTHRCSRLVRPPSCRSTAIRRRLRGWRRMRPTKL